jgi:hypothetical protein
MLGITATTTTNAPKALQRHRVVDSDMYSQEKVFAIVISESTYQFFLVTGYAVDGS